MKVNAAGSPRLSLDLTVLNDIMPLTATPVSDSISPGRDEDLRYET